MSFRIFRYAAIWALGLGIGLGGCHQSSNPQSASSGTLNSDGTTSQSATPSGSSATPGGQPATTTNSAAVPAPDTPAPIVRPVLTAPQDARVTVTITEQLSASRDEVGDRFTGVLSRPVVTKDGSVVFPRGTKVEGTVVASKGKGRFKGAGALGIELTSIGGTRVSTTEYEQEAKGRGKRSAGLIGGGGGLGAIIGGIAGGGKGALIGGLAGAGAGTAGAAYTGNRDVIIPSESTVVFRLTAPVSAK